MSTINLLPKDYVQRRSQHRTNTMCIALFAVVMVGVIGASMVSERSTRQTEQVRDRVNTDYAKAAHLLGQIQQLEDKKRQGIRKAKATTALLERAPRSYLLAIVTQALPKHSSLSKLSLKPVRKVHRIKPSARKGTKFAAAKKRNEASRPPETIMTMEVIGWAATDVQVAGFITNLLGCPLLSAVNLDYSQEKTVRSKIKDKPDLHIREFKITVELKPNVDVINLIKSDQGQARSTDVSGGQILQVEPNTNGGTKS